MNWYDLYIKFIRWLARYYILIEKGQYMQVLSFKRTELKKKLTLVKKTQLEIAFDKRKEAAAKLIKESNEKILKEIRRNKKKKE